MTGPTLERRHVKRWLRLTARYRFDLTGWVREVELTERQIAALIGAASEDVLAERRQWLDACALGLRTHAAAPHPRPDLLPPVPHPLTAGSARAWAEAFHRAWAEACEAHRAADRGGRTR